MSFREHSSMFKSKSGRHLAKNESRERLHAVKKENRVNNRHDMFTNRRNIEPTPHKSNGPVASTSNDQNDAETHSTLSRQQTFRERFKNYMDKKRNEKPKSKPKPFVSAAVSGRYVLNPEVAVSLPKKKKIEKPSITQRPLAIFDTPKHSPINTRSKKLQLVSPLQMPTPRRRNKRRSADMEMEDAQTQKATTSKLIARPFVKAKRTLRTETEVKSMLVKKPSNSTADLIKSVPIRTKKTATTTRPLTATKTVSRPAANAKATIAKSVVRPTTKPAPSKPTLGMKPASKKPVSVKSITEPPKLPKNFVFGPKSSFGGVLTSTAMRTNRKSKPSISSDKKKPLFDETIR